MFRYKKTFTLIMSTCLGWGYYEFWTKYLSSNWVFSSNTGYLAPMLAISIIFGYLLGKSVKEKVIIMLICLTCLIISNFILLIIGIKNSWGEF